MKASDVREAFFAIDGQQQVVIWAPAAEAMLGFTAGEALGRPCWQILHGSDVFGRPLCCDQCRACLQSGAFVAPPAHHFLIRQRGGRLMRLIHELIPLPSGPGARALVCLSESSFRRPNPSDELLPANEASPGLTTFGDIVKGLAALGHLTDSLSSSSFYQVLDSTLDRVLGLTGSEAAEVFLWNRSSGEMCQTAHRGLFRSAFRQITRFEANQGFPGLVATTSEPLVTNELMQDPRFLRTRVKEKGVRSFLSVPLRSDKGVIGCLNLASRRHEERGDSRLQLLSWLAGPLASAAELAILRSQEKVNWLDEGEFRREALPGQVLKAMMDVSEADQGIINLWGSDGAVVHCESNSRAVVPCIRQRTGHQCPAHLTERPVVNTGPGSAATAACRESLGEARTAVCVPIRALGRSIGVVSLRFLRPQPVPTRPLALLGAMARSAGRVLREAWPYLEEESHGLAPAEGSSKEMRKGWLQAAERGPVSPGEVIEARKAESPAQVRPPFLDLRCFGSFQIYSDGNPLPPASFGRRQSFTVLKILVTRRGRPVSPDFLSETLWPDTEPEATKKRLWVIIHNLRMALEPGLKHGQPSHFIHRNGDAYTFDPGVPFRLDVDEFTQGLARGDCSEAKGDLRDAAAAYEQTTRLYGGDFMEEELYSDWCSAEREYLREVYLALLGRLASLYATWKEWDRSIAWRRRALLADGLREETHRELMRCLRSAGRRDEALRQYQECRLVLDRELSVEPLPETSKIYREILEEEKHSSAS